MNQHYDAIIVGGGVIGTSIAYNLSKRGRKVLLLERNQIASRASKAAAGMLGAQTEIKRDGPFFQLAKQSRVQFPSLAHELKEVSGIDIEFFRNGMIKVARTEDEALHLKELVRHHQEMGEQAEWMTASVLSRTESALSNVLKGGMSIEQDGNVSSLQLTKAFAHSAQLLGTEIKEYTEVNHLILGQNKVNGVSTTGGSYFSEEVIIAGGAWSQTLLDSVGIDLQSFPVKGECFSVKTKRQLIAHTIFTEDCYIVPKTGNRLLIGATEHAHSFDETVSLDGISSLISRATKLLPGLSDTIWEKAWAGIRPQTARGIPQVGRCKDWEGLIIATGHYRNGVLLAPITGVMVADLLEGIETDSIFSFQTINHSTK
ncbi:glycine oxidase ThiO [Bacillus sp. 2205SS5-2]|uniref:glycine oxidase ThiO n=1 Tax=Bacillus sp. 2205SS5-2 TaxID=3109031 RepID=UPI003004AA23